MKPSHRLLYVLAIGSLFIASCGRHQNELDDTQQQRIDRINSLRDSSNKDVIPEFAHYLRVARSQREAQAVIDELVYTTSKGYDGNRTNAEADAALVLMNDARNRDRLCIGVIPTSSSGCVGEGEDAIIIGSEIAEIDDLIEGNCTNFSDGFTLGWIHPFMDYFRENAPTLQGRGDAARAHTFTLLKGGMFGCKTRNAEP